MDILETVSRWCKFALKVSETHFRCRRKIVVLTTDQVICRVIFKLLEDRTKRRNIFWFVVSFHEF